MGNFKIILTKEKVFEHWKNAMNKYGNNVYIENGTDEYDHTYMGEDAAVHFKVSTDSGQSEIETNIFEWAVDFTKTLNNEEKNLCR